MGRWKIIPEQKDEYLGNMWGWKFSFFGLALLVILMSLMAMRYCQTMQDPESIPIELQMPDNI